MPDPLHPEQEAKPPRPEEEAESRPEAPASAGASPAAHDPAQSPPPAPHGPPRSDAPPERPGEAPYAKDYWERGWSDNLDLIKALFLGGVLTAFFYELFPLPFLDQGRILSFFDNNISPVIVAMTFWSSFILLFKFLRFRAQNRAWQSFHHPRVRGLLDRKIYARDVERVAARLKGEMEGLRVKRYQRSIVYRRVLRMLHIVRTASRKEGLDSLLDYQAQIDLKKLESSYTILQVFIWAIPILGFIGTVLGIGFSVNEFAQFIQTAEGGAQFSGQMRMALSGVTSGLAVAFNTTFLALVLVIPVMLLTSFLHKTEEELLLEIEEYCLEELLPNLHVTPGEEALAEGFDDHLHRILRLSDTWLGQFQPLVERLSQQAEMMSHQLSGIQPLVKEFTDRLLLRKAAERPPPLGEGALASPENAEGEERPPRPARGV